MEIVYHLAGEERRRPCGGSASEAAEVLRQVQDELITEGQVATRVLVNAEEVPATPEALVEHLLSTGEGPGVLVTVEAVPYRDLLLDTARTAVEYLTRLGGAIPQLADRLYAGEAVDPETLSELFAGLGWVAEFLVVGYPNLVQGADGGKGASELLVGFSQTVMRLADLDGDYDPVFLADLLLYEILPAAERVRTATAAACGEAGPGHG